jgi:hypothetical protein
MRASLPAPQSSCDILTPHAIYGGHWLISQDLRFMNASCTFFAQNNNMDKNRSELETLPQAAHNALAASGMA